MNQQDAANFVMALNAIAGFVPPMMMQPLVNSPVAQILQAVANGQMALVPHSVEAASTKPRLVQDAEAPKTGS